MSEQALETSTTETALDTSLQDSGTTSEQTNQILDLDSHEKFLYKGREVTRQELESGHMRHEDYTRKTQEIAQERRYFANLDADLEKVRNNPSLAEEFKRIYPEQYHNFLRYTQSNSATRPQSAGSGQSGNYDPELMTRFERLERAHQEREVAAINSEIENISQKYSKKYPYADEEPVLARAQALVDHMKKTLPPGQQVRISEMQWDALWKSVNDRSKAISENAHKKQVQDQIAANRKGSDVASGGGVPGHAPRNFKNLREASDAARRDFAND